MLSNRVVNTYDKTKVSIEMSGAYLKPDSYLLNKKATK